MRIFIAGVWAVVFALAPTARALPTYDAPWPKIALKDDSGQNPKSWLRDDQDEQLIWLLPPAHGAIEVTGKAPKQDPKPCAQLKAKLNNLSASNEEFRDYVAYIVAAIPRLLQVTSSFNRSAAAIASWQQRSDVHHKMSGYLKARQSARRQLDIIEGKQQHCDDFCHEWRLDGSIAHTLLTDARQSLLAFEKSHPEPYRELLALDRAQQNAEDEHSELNGQLASYRQHIAELDTLLTRSYRQLANQPADTLAVSYLPGHEAMLSRWRANNPGYRFQVVPMTQMKLYARLVPTKIDDYYLASIPAFLGFEAEGFARLRAGEWLKSPQATKLPEQLKGRFYLSLHGACSLDASFFKDKGLAIERQQDEDALPRFAAVLQYHYPVTIKEDITIRFNAAAIYEALMKGHRAGQADGIITGEGFATILATDALRPLIAFAGAPLSWQRRDMIISTIAYQVLTMMTEPTLTLAAELTSPFALTPTLTEPPLSRASGGWLPLSGKGGKAEQAALKRLRAMPEQVRAYGPGKPLLVPGMTHFGHFRLDGL